MLWKKPKRRSSSRTGGEFAGFLLLLSRVFVLEFSECSRQASLQEVFWSDGSVTDWRSVQSQVRAIITLWTQIPTLRRRTMSVIYSICHSKSTEVWCYFVNQKSAYIHPLLCIITVKCFNISESYNKPQTQTIPPSFELKSSGLQHH